MKNIRNIKFKIFNNFWCLIKNIIFLFLFYVVIYLEVFCGYFNQFCYYFCEIGRQ